MILAVGNDPDGYVASWGAEALWLTAGTQGPPGAIADASLPGLQALAQVIGRGALPNARYRVHDLDCLRRETPSQRSPRQSDFTPELAALTRKAWDGEPLPSRVVIHSLSRIWEQALAQVGSGLGSSQGPQVALYGRALVADALHQLVSDLQRGGKEVMATACLNIEDGIAYPAIPGTMHLLIDRYEYLEEARHVR